MVIASEKTSPPLHDSEWQATSLGTKVMTDKINLPSPAIQVRTTVCHRSGRDWHDVIIKVSRVVPPHIALIFRE